MWAKTLVKREAKTKAVQKAKKCSIMLSNKPQMHLKLLQKTAETTGDLISNIISNKITKNHSKALQKQLKMKQKYQKKDIYLQKKDRKLLMN